MRRSGVNLLLVTGVVLLVATAYLVGVRAGPGVGVGGGAGAFAGTDGQVTAAIRQTDPGYDPWFRPFLQVESGEIQSGLFALQAGLGGLALGYCLGVLRGRRLTRQRSGGPDATTGRAR